MQTNIEKIKTVTDFSSLIEYLYEELDWPINVLSVDEITFDYDPEELGITADKAVIVRSIKQIRPLTDNQPWGLFYIEFELKKLPVVILRRILKALIYSTRKKSERMKSWDLDNLIFISSLGEMEERKISFAHFNENISGLPELRTFSWDKFDTELRYKQSILDLDKLRWPENEKDTDSWKRDWESAFSTSHRYVIRTSKELAVKMAQLAILIRDQIKEIYIIENKDGALHYLFQSFKQVLLHDLTLDSFADMYAQTITYGLFSAKATNAENFREEDILSIIPDTNPFLKQLFNELKNASDINHFGLDLDELGVSELIETLKEIDIETVLRDFGRQKRGEDPVIHFYENFLNEYDSVKKVKRGVFYTPDPIVSFIVKSVDTLLKSSFEIADGLADSTKVRVNKSNRKNRRRGNRDVVEYTPIVQILDPATGTGTFLKYVIKQIKATFDKKHANMSTNDRNDRWNEYVSNNLLNRLFGFELMLAPYAVAHLKLGLELAETGYEFKSNQRLGVFLCNSLSGDHKGAGTLDAYFDWLAEESHKANLVKAQNNINVIIGNPPYSISSLNKGLWISNLIDDYKKDLNEKKINLDDDFIKFIRFCQWKIDKTGSGIIGFITNHTYIDGITHRRMRESLMDSFDSIYVLDLHGSVMGQGKCPDGTKDENVFDIEQGVCISIFIKNNTKQESKIYHADLWGLRENKYETLSNSSISDINWTELKPIKPDYFFVPKDFSLNEEYSTFYSVDEIFPFQSYGIQSKRDKLFIHFSIDELESIVPDVIHNSNNEQYLNDKYSLKSSSGWSPKKLHDLSYDEHYIKKIMYRPYDYRYIYYDPKAMGRARYKTMHHMLNDNIGLVIMRQVFQHFNEYNHFGVTKTLIDERTFYSNRGGTYLFPLYTFSKKGNRISNISKDFIRRIEETTRLSYVDSDGDLENTVDPGNILNYIYAIVHSKSYRKRYEEFLKIKFPRIPIPSSKDLFIKLTKTGESLINSHLMNVDLDNLTTKYYGTDNPMIKKAPSKSKSLPISTDGKSRIYFNSDDFIEGIPEHMWYVNTGGYQVCYKWIKDRVGRILQPDDIKNYQKIIEILIFTDNKMTEIDEIINNNGGWPFN